ncbi:ParB/RepB/Spo0J family partition protein [Bacillus sp. REN16]|uniref:ParB/RepB/Spo0J family partition protein n=1 Tax=Bacillus sp. REN16 TaxID=2887296 RepID=UPI001E3088C8|nr:ParB/RepB/Spo0J family partition protein [Bacillus sp. REN16]MCC3359632.1 ParB/RepB/Spo0J family partition protein [Bacillus sp. REN16]
MNKQLKMIRLSQIRLEISFRENEKDLGLKLSIQREGLKVPLIVEEESKNHYVLVEGYRRYFALEYLNIEYAECIVENPTSENERILKRLGLELQSKKKTSYQMERMIFSLLQNGYDAKTIASYCSVTKATISKYIHGAGVNPDWIRRGEEANVGRHVFTAIHKLDIDIDIKEIIVDQYIKKTITKTTVEAIKKATNEKAFQDIPKEKIQDCIERIMMHQSLNNKVVKEIVNEISLQSVYKKENHLFMYKLSFQSLTKVQTILNLRHFTDYLTEYQKKQLLLAINKLLHTLNPPSKWTEFSEDGKPDEADNNFKH